MHRQTDFKIHGLDCSEEVTILQREVGRRQGVLDLSFDVVNGRMSVEFDPDVVTTEELIAHIDATGMKAVPWKQRGIAEDKDVWARHGRFLMAAISGGLLVAGFITHWALHRSFMDAFAGGNEPAHTYPMTSIFLYGASVLTGAWFVLPKAVQSARRLRPDMNLLMVIAVLGALMIGEWFEAAMVAFLFAVSLLLEHWSVERARNAIGALMDLSPTTARYVCPHDGDIMEKPVAEVPVGVTVLVRPGEKIPLDGVVTKGESTVNQAAITGESMPVPKGAGDEVFAGTLNEDGAMEFRATKAADDTTLARIIHMVQEARPQATKC